MFGARSSELALKGGLDWLHVTIAACDGAGNYAAHEGRVPPQVNMVELICSSADGHPAYAAARVLAAGIADLLGWEVTDSESGEVLYAGPAAAGVYAARLTRSSCVVVARLPVSVMPRRRRAP